MKIIRLGIGPMIGIEQAFFISLLGLRPSRFRWNDHGDGSADRICELRNCSLIRTIIDKKQNEIEFKKQMKIIRLGIGPMIGSSRLFFISLLGLRPGRFKDLKEIKIQVRM